MRISVALSQIVPQNISTAEAFLCESVFELHPEVLRAVQHCSYSRIREFSVGRACAAFALANLGVEGWPLLKGARGEPLWPSGFVGSITHAGEICYAAVSKIHHNSSIGIDCECIGSINEDMWSIIYTSEEIKYLKSVDERSRDLTAAVIFSAKESFYKMQFPICGAWIDYIDVSVEIEDNYIYLKCHDISLKSEFHALTHKGEFLICGNYVLTSFVNHNE